MDNPKSILMVIAPKDFMDEEYFIPKQIFEENKFIVKIASTTQHAISFKGKEVVTDLLLSEATTDYDAIVFSGGLGAKIYLDDPFVHNLIKEFYNKNKLIAAICISPSIFANAGLLKRKKATAHPSQENNLKQKEVNYTGETVTVDGKIVTGNGPDASKEFGETIVRALE